MKNKVLIAASSAVLLLALAGCGTTSSTTGAPKQDGQSHSQQSPSKGSGSSDTPSASDKDKAADSSQGTAQTDDSAASSKAFDALGVSQRNQLFANWLANAKGAFKVYNVDTSTTIFINDGANGAQAYADGQYQGSAGVSLREEENSAKFVVVGDLVSLYVPAGEAGGVGYSGNWKALTWKLQETKTKADLMKISQSNSQIFQTANGSPQ